MTIIANNSPMGVRKKQVLEAMADIDDIRIETTEEVNTILFDISKQTDYKLTIEGVCNELHLKPVDDAPDRPVEIQLVNNTANLLNIYVDGAETGYTIEAGNSLLIKLRTDEGVFEDVALFWGGSNVTKLIDFNLNGISSCINVGDVPVSSSLKSFETYEEYVAWCDEVTLRCSEGSWTYYKDATIFINIDARLLNGKIFERNDEGIPLPKLTSGVGRGYGNVYLITLYNMEDDFTMYFTERGLTGSVVSNYPRLLELKHLEDKATTIMLRTKPLDGSAEEGCIRYKNAEDPNSDDCIPFTVAFTSKKTFKKIQIRGFFAATLPIFGRDNALVSETFLDEMTFYHSPYRKMFQIKPDFAESVSIIYDDVTFKKKSTDPDWGEYDISIIYCATRWEYFEGSGAMYPPNIHLLVRDGASTHIEGINDTLNTEWVLPQERYNVSLDYVGKAVADSTYYFAIPYSHAPFDPTSPYQGDYREQFKFRFNWYCPTSIDTDKIPLEDDQIDVVSINGSYVSTNTKGLQFATFN